MNKLFEQIKEALSDAFPMHCNAIEKDYEVDNVYSVTLYGVEPSSMAKVEEEIWKVIDSFGSLPGGIMLIPSVVSIDDTRALHPDMMPGRLPCDVGLAAILCQSDHDWTYGEEVPEIMGIDNKDGGKRYAIAA